MKNYKTTKKLWLEKNKKVNISTMDLVIYLVTIIYTNYM